VLLNRENFFIVIIAPPSLPSEGRKKKITPCYGGGGGEPDGEKWKKGANKFKKKKKERQQRKMNSKRHQGKRCYYCGKNIDNSSWRRTQPGEYIHGKRGEGESFTNQNSGLLGEMKTEVGHYFS
jgi:hypothetical protein